MLLFDKLGLCEPRKQLLQQHVQQPWTPQVTAKLSVLFEQLVSPGPCQDLELCKQLLFDDKCGAFCELQVSNSNLKRP